MPEDVSVCTQSTVSSQDLSHHCEFVVASVNFNSDYADATILAQPTKTTRNARQPQSRVAVILGYFNGQTAIGEQLQSIIEQSHSEFHIFICDDNSNPCFSFEGLCLDKDSLSKISVAVRPQNIGFSSNFLTGLAGISGEFEYFAFSDQDDIWYENKLEKAIIALEKFSSKEPALYCARVEIADDVCEKVLGYSPLFDKAPSFANALVQNIGGGNTMVFNKAAKDLILKASQDVTVGLHDWWCYQVVAGAGGHVIYDPEPCLKYRQHAYNIIGASSNWSARLSRIRGLLAGRLRARNDINIKALSKHKNLLTASNQQTLNDFIEARRSPFVKRILLFKRSGIYCQTLVGSLGLLLGVFLNKV